MATTASPTATSIASGRPIVEPAIYEPARSSRGLYRDAWRRLLRNKLAVGGMLLIAVMVLVALLADVLPLPDPTYQFPASSYAPPSTAHLLGTDSVGRDLLSRLVHGARVSLAVAVFAQAIILVLGLTLGGLAGFWPSTTGRCQACNLDGLLRDLSCGDECCRRSDCECGSPDAKFLCAGVSKY